MPAHRLVEPALKGAWIFKPHQRSGNLEPGILGYPVNEVVPLLSVAYQKTGADVALTNLSHKHAGLTTEQATRIAFYKLQAYMRLDKKDKAQALIKEIRTFNTASPFKSLTLVYQLLIDKNDEAALIQLDTVLANAPFHSDALKLKALMLLQQDNKTAAARVYQTYPARQTALLYLASG